MKGEGAHGPVAAAGGPPEESLGPVVRVRVRMRVGVGVGVCVCVCVCVCACVCVCVCVCVAPVPIVEMASCLRSRSRSRLDHRPGTEFSGRLVVQVQNEQRLAADACSRSGFFDRCHHASPALPHQQTRTGTQRPSAQACRKPLEPQRVPGSAAMT